MAHRLHHLIAVAVLALLPLGTPAGDRWQRDGGLGAILKPDEAFRLMPVEARGTTLRIEWDIAPGYYMYLHRLKFESADPAVTLGAPKLPAGEKHHDEHFGDVVIQRAGRLVAEIPASAIPKTLKLTYQGCAEVGVCLPPQLRDVAVVALP